MDTECKLKRKQRFENLEKKSFGTGIKKYDIPELMPIIDFDDTVEFISFNCLKTLEDLKKQRELDSWVFETQYMQKPKPIEGLLFPESTTKYYDALPSDPDYIFSFVDPADGHDYTASIVYYIKNKKVFVANVLYNREDTTISIPKILAQLKQFGVATCIIESNSAWSLFRKAIKEKAAEMGIATNIRSVSQHTNKELRIFNHAPSITSSFHYPKNAENNETKLYLKHRHSYLKLVKNQVDDGVDADAAACEWLKKNGIIPVI